MYMRYGETREEYAQRVKDYINVPQYPPQFSEAIKEGLLAELPGGGSFVVTNALKDFTDFLYRHTSKWPVLPAKIIRSFIFQNTDKKPYTIGTIEQELRKSKPL